MAIELWYIIMLHVLIKTEDVELRAHSVAKNLINIFNLLTKNKLMGSKILQSSGVNYI